MRGLEISIDILMKEYIQMRQEVVGCISSQERILGLTITLCVGIFTIGYYFTGTNIAYYFFLGLLGPSSICFIGVYWINMVFQQKRYDMYIRELEVKISGVLQNLSETDAIINWEEYINAEHISTLKNKQIKITPKSLLGQKVFLGMYLTVPIFMYLSSYIEKVYELNIEEFIKFFISSNLHLAVVSMLCVVYLAFLLVICIYIRKLSNIQKYIESLKSPEYSSIKYFL